MIELIRKIVSEEVSHEMKIHKARESLQIIALKILYDRGYFKNLAFLGGTALRVLYDLRRFSEDLDFSLIREKGYDYENLLESLHREFKAWGLPVEIKPGREKTVRSAMLKFKDILFDLGLSPIRNEKLSIRVEIDQNPPEGWNTEISLVSKEFLFSITHFDLFSMYATKLHDCFYRRYQKGRDFYDFLWYLGKKIKPNFTLLNNAILQTHGTNLNIHEGNFKDFLLKKVKGIDFKRIKRDVEVFLIDKNELNLFDAKIIFQLIDKI